MYITVSYAECVSDKTCFLLMMQDLLQELKSKLSGNFGQVILALMMTPIAYDAYELRNAVKVSKIACLENV